MRKIIISSLLYNANGHAKGYIDNLILNLGDEFEFSVFIYGPKSDDSRFYCYEKNSQDLNYKKEKFSIYKKILRRFISSFGYYDFLRKNISDNDLVYFMDYEYISLFLSLFKFKNNSKIIWMHSATYDKRSIRGLYKLVFYKLLRLFFKPESLSFVVNGDYTKKILEESFSEYSIESIQYPTDYKVEVIPKKLAKTKYGFEDKYIYSSIGMIRSDKNYELLFRVFSKSSVCNNENYILLIAGSLSDLDEDYFLKLKDKYNINNVRFIFKYFSFSELDEIFSLSDCLLMTYGFNNTSQSGPLSLCREFLLPSVVFSGGEIGFYSSSNNVGFVAKDEIEYINGIDFISKNPNYYYGNLIKVKEKYSWEMARVLYSKVFNKV